MATRCSGTVTLVTTKYNTGYGLVVPDGEGADPCKYTEADVVYGGPLVKGQAVFFEIEGVYDRRARKIRTDS